MLLIKRKRKIAKKCDEKLDLNRISQIIQIVSALYGAYQLAKIAKDVSKVTKKTLNLETEIGKVLAKAFAIETLLSQSSSGGI